MPHLLAFLRAGYAQSKSGQQRFFPQLANFFTLSFAFDDPLFVLTSEVI